MIKEFRDIDALSPADFEVFVKELFLASGWYDAEITKTGKEYKYGDGGVDIFAYKNKRKFAIEVKQRRIDITVDVTALNQLVTGAKLANVKNMILVTNSYFTSETQIRALMLGVELIDRDELQNLWIKKHSEIGRDIKPRKYQVDVINDALAQYEKKKTKILIEMATGLGKTYTVAYILKEIFKIESKKLKVLFLAHQIEILIQSVTAFKNVLGVGNYTFSACFAGATPENTDFVFASFDTLYGQINNLKKNNFDVIIVDEAHHTPAKTYSEVVKNFTPRLLIGLTATPYRTDNKDVLSFFGGDEGHIGRYDLVWALKHRKLAIPKYLVLTDDLNQEKIDQLESGLTISDLDKRLFLHKKDQEVVRIIEKTVHEQKIENVKGIIFCKNIRHMQHLIGFFKFGTATLVHSKMLDKERRENIRNFREGEYKYILVCDLFNEGVDIPETNLLVFMRNTKSQTIWLQQLGRGLRKTPNKEFVYVLDFIGSLHRLKEIKSLSRRIKNMPLDVENLYDELNYMEKEIYHDNSLDVIYSSAAARIFNLIEDMEMLLNSKEVLINKLNNYYIAHNDIPFITEIEEKLDISLDQVATHFGSYYSYLLAALNYKINKEELSNRLQRYVDLYTQDNGLKPSLKAIANHFSEGVLNEFSEKEIDSLLPVVEENNLKKDKIKASVLDEQKKLVYIPECPILNKYKGIVFTRRDFNSLHIMDKEKIKAVYPSTSVFIKKLSEIR